MHTFLLKDSFCSGKCLFSSEAYFTPFSVSSLSIYLSPIFMNARWVANSTRSIGELKKCLRWIDASRQGPFLQSALHLRSHTSGPFRRKWATGSRGGIRTPDRVVNSHLLCQLSYPGIFDITICCVLIHRNFILYQKSYSFVK